MYKLANKKTQFLLSAFGKHCSELAIQPFETLIFNIDADLQ